MMFKQYKNKVAGYKGWIETATGEVFGFIKDNGKIVTEW